MTAAARVLRLLGPRLDEVAAFVKGLGATPIPIAWDARPEVHVKCPDARVVEAVLQRFGEAVYSLDGSPLEAVALRALAAAGWTLATAESCTGGLIGHLLTGVPGCSEVYRAGVIAYSNEAKTSLLGVDAAVIDAHGAVSRPVVEAMAEGARRMAGADVGVGVSGVAGPGGGTPAKPVGTVWVAWAGPAGLRSACLALEGSRDDVKRQAALRALDGVRRMAEGLDAAGAAGATPDGPATAGR